MRYAGLMQFPSAQGIVGSIPWTALVFFTLYLQLLGMSDFAASVLMALFLGSTGAPSSLRIEVYVVLLTDGNYIATVTSTQYRAALGGLLGGYVGDLAARRHPHHGRIYACQFSVAIGIPFSLLILKVRCKLQS